MIAEIVFNNTKQNLSEVSELLEGLRVYRVKISVYYL
jgi:hypothetical protein